MSAEQSLKTKIVSEIERGWDVLTCLSSLVEQIDGKPPEQNALAEPSTKKDVDIDIEASAAPASEGTTPPAAAAATAEAKDTKVPITLIDASKTGPLQCLKCVEDTTKLDSLQKDLAYFASRKVVALRFDF